MSQELTDADKATMDKIRKLLDKAASTTFPAEKETFQKKAEDLMVQYNLDAALVERSTGQDGKREDMRTRGGFYQYQRDLWKAVAELHFCLYWTQQYSLTKDEYCVQQGFAKHPKWMESRGRYISQKRHRLVGRFVNTTSARVMAQYLEEAIERAVRETLHTPDDRAHHGNAAHSFRRGVVEDLVERVGQRYRDRLSADKARVSAAEAAAARAAGAGFSASTTVALADFEQSEHDKNMDHLRGEGWSARQRASAAQDARDRAEREAAYAQWARANPEEARAKAEAEAEKSRKYWSRRMGGRTSSGGADNTDWGAYARGRRAASSISIDQQTDHRAAKGRLTHG